MEANFHEQHILRIFAQKEVNYNKTYKLGFSSKYGTL